MQTIKCPKCATLMKLQQQAAAVKVKCPKCATVLKVPGTQSAPALPLPQSAPAKAQPAKAQPARPQKTVAGAATPALSEFDNPFEGIVDAGSADPFSAVDPFATVSGPESAAFDFGSMDFPAAPASPVGFPIAGGSPFPSSPRPSAAAAPASVKPVPGVARENRKFNKKTLWIAIGAGAFVLIGLLVVVIVAVAKTPGSGKSPTAASVAISVPDGYESSTVAGVAFVVPNGKSMDKPPTSIEAKVFESSASGATFFVGVDAYEYLNPSPAQLSYRAGRMIMSDVYGGAAVERDGHSGIQGASVGGMLLADMKVEYYLVDGNVILIGCGMPGPRIFDEELADRATDQEEPSSDDTRKLQVFQEEEKAFFSSIRI